MFGGIRLFETEQHVAYKCKVSIHHKAARNQGATKFLSVDTVSNILPFLIPFCRQKKNLIVLSYHVLLCLEMLYLLFEIKMDFFQKAFFYFAHL